MPLPAFPARKTTSSACSLSSKYPTKRAKSSFETTGPFALISVSWSLFNFKLIRVTPSISTNSTRIPSFSRASFIKFPENPAKKPVAVFSKPKRFKTTDILIPFPPAT